MASKSDILKSNMVLGASQVVQMLVTIVRSKLIAVFLGSTGMAVNAIFQSLLQMIYNIASCGLMQSGVREFSQASSDDYKRTGVLPFKFAVFKTLIVIAGLVGLAVCVILAWPMSYISFGNTEYIVGFILLGAGLFFYMMMHGEMTVLQGTRSFHRLAKSTICGSLLSLVVCVPCYYYFGVNGIVVSIVLGYLLFWLTYRYHRIRLNIKPISVSVRKAFLEGKDMLALGVILMIGTALVSVFTYLTNISIRAIGNLDDVGFFQGAASLVTQSIAVVFAVLASDFFPRLSAAIDNSEEKNNLINQQLSVVISIIPVIVVVIICFPQFLIRLLLSEEFIVVTPLLQFMAASLVFRGVWIIMSYVILAHGDRKRYLIFDAIIGNGLAYVINIVAYSIGGLQYLGVSYLVSSIAVCVILFTVVSKYYKYRMERHVLIQVILIILLVGVTVVAMNIWQILGWTCGVITVAYCMYTLFAGSNILASIKNRLK